MPYGRDREQALIGQLLDAARESRSGALVLRGEAGVVKSALLGYLSDRAAGRHVARAVGVESEMELAYSGLHQLCASMLDHLERLPVPQRDALVTVFGRSGAVAADRHRVYGALAEAADAETDPDRRAWHRAHATPGPSEEVAAELERSAGQAQARSGLAAPAAFPGAGA